jgi:hypothetical protein
LKRADAVNRLDLNGLLHSGLNNTSRGYRLMIGSRAAAPRTRFGRRTGYGSLDSPSRFIGSGFYPNRSYRVFFGHTDLSKSAPAASTCRGLTET